MTDEEFESLKLPIMCKADLEKALVKYGAGVDGWGDLFDYEKPRVIKLAYRMMEDRNRSRSSKL